MKKIVLIAVPVVAILTALGVWFFRSKGTQEVLPPPPPPVETTTVTGLSNTALAYYWVANGAIMTISEEGIIARLGSGSETVLSNQTIADLGSTLASPDGSRLLVSFGPLRSPTFSLFDVRSAAWKPLEAGTVAAAWSPNGAELATLKKDTTGLSLGTVSASTLKRTEQMKLSGGDLIVSWPSAKKIYLTERPSARYSITSFVFDISKRTLSPLMAPKAGLSLLWDKDGSKALAFESTAQNKLSVINDVGGLVGALPFLTVPEKCTLASGSPASGYCAIPEQIPSGALLPDDLLTGSLRTSDGFFAWTLGSNKIVTIRESGTVPFDAEHITVTDKKIRFINRYDRKLYEISIP